MAQAVIGLGNPGPEYRNTRHNVGQRVVDALARRIHARFEREGGHAVAPGRWQGEPLYLIKPGSFMNVTGGRRWRASPGKLHLGPADLVVVFDDIDLPLGKVRVRQTGSAGGHNGVRSMIEAFGTDALRRVKIGVGPSRPAGRGSRPGRRPRALAVLAGGARRGRPGLRRGGRSGHEARGGPLSAAAA